MQVLNYIEKFKRTQTWATMVATVEASPWHREANVAVHTEMVMQQYIDRFMPHRLERQNKVALIALLFHDVGKPEAEEVLQSPDRGTYRRYAGHEQNSAVAFTEHWLRDAYLRALLTQDDARRVRWIIEHHLPYGLKDNVKRQALRTAIDEMFGVDANTFYDCLRADAAGRISDDHDTKLKAVDTWIQEFDKITPNPVSKFNERTCCYVLIGPSGSGKSTWIKSRRRLYDHVLSMDTMRLKFMAEQLGVEIQDTPEFYAQAWEFANKAGPKFDAFMAAEIRRTVQEVKLTRGNLFIDNVNASKKARARWVQEGRNLGMKIVGVEFWNSLNVLLERQHTRGDKSVPGDSVKKQFYSQTCAWLGSEVDEVQLVIGD